MIVILVFFFVSVLAATGAFESSSSQALFHVAATAKVQSSSSEALFHAATAKAVAAAKFNYLKIGGVSDDSQDKQQPHFHYSINCTTWHEVDVGKKIGEGGHRTVHSAKFRGKHLVVKIAKRDWVSRTRNERSVVRAFVREIAAFENIRHASTPKLYGYCLDPKRSNGTYGIVMERLWQFYQILRLPWYARATLAKSGFSVLKAWRPLHVPADGSLRGKFLWDIKQSNFGADRKMKSLKMIDMEAIVWSESVDLEEENREGIANWSTCANRTLGCWPTRQWSTRPDDFPQLDELQCVPASDQQGSALRRKPILNAASAEFDITAYLEAKKSQAAPRYTCKTLDHRTLWALYCYHVAQPLLLEKLPTISEERKESLSEDLNRLLKLCMSPDPMKRPNPVAMAFDLERVLADYGNETKSAKPDWILGDWPSDSEQ